jgi:hypothetical protein
LICRFRITSMAVPTARPQKWFMPPRIVMISTSADFGQNRKSATTLRVKMPNRPPAMPEKPPEITKAAS